MDDSSLQDGQGLDFVIRVNVIQEKSYEVSMKPLREKYNFKIVGDPTVPLGKYFVEDMSPDKRFLAMFGLIDPEKSLKNRKTCHNPPKFLSNLCNSSSCIHWELCIFERKGEKWKAK